MSLVSFNTFLKGEVASFCEAEGVECSRTANIILQLISSLASYKEEGVELSPDVFICDDIEKLSQIITSSEIVHVGKGDLDKATTQLALKRCAPLAISGWSIFIERDSANLKMKYGLIRQNSVPMSVSLSKSLQDIPKELSVLYAVKLSQNLVFVKGNVGQERTFSLSPDKDYENPFSKLEDLVECMTKDVDEDNRGEVTNLLLNELEKILKKTHGTLIAVVDNAKNVTDEFIDWTKLETPLKFHERVRDFKASRDIESFEGVLGLISLLEGMLASDGITVIDTKCQVLGYRYFHSTTNASGASSNQGSDGGARRRTFDKLSELVPSKIVGIFMKSQDGSMHCKVE